MTFQLTGTDAMNSVLNRIAADGQCQRQSFSPYGGNSTALAHTPGFNGERRDPLTGTTHLGNGYRAYNPSLMRFHAPDSMSPFGAGGINCYAYCSGDPINNSDPSGHMKRSTLGRQKQGPARRIVDGLISVGDVATAIVRSTAAIEKATVGASVSLEKSQRAAKLLQRVPEGRISSQKTRGKITEFSTGKLKPEIESIMDQAKFGSIEDKIADINRRSKEFRNSYIPNARKLHSSSLKEPAKVSVMSQQEILSLNDSLDQEFEYLTKNKIINLGHKGEVQATIELPRLSCKIREIAPLTESEYNDLSKIYSDMNEWFGREFKPFYHPPSSSNA